MSAPLPVPDTRSGSPPSCGGTPGPWSQAVPVSASGVLLDVARMPLFLWRARDLVGTFLGRDLSSRFRGTVLGWLWPLVQPTLLFLVYGFLFAQVLGLRMPGAGEGLGSSYGLYLFSGALVWSSFAESLTRATTSLVDGRHLLGKLTFPAELLPLTPVLGGAVTLAFGVLVTLATTALTGIHPTPGSQLLWIPVLFALGTIFTYGLALLCASMHIHLRDTREGLVCLLTVFLFATPVFWVPSAEIFPSIEPWIPLIEASPLHLWISGWRGVLMAGEPTAIFTQSVAQCCAGLLPWSLGALLLGRAVFAALERGFADET